MFMIAIIDRARLLRTVVLMPALLSAIFGAAATALPGQNEPQAVRESLVRNGEDMPAFLDRLHYQDRHAEVVEAAEVFEARASAGNKSDDAAARLLAALRWRKARAQFIQLERRYRAGELKANDLSEHLERITELTSAAVNVCDDRAQPRFWWAAALALQARQQRSLRALATMRRVRELIGEVLEEDPELADAHFLMGQLYRELPGRPLSWGSTRAAVSSARRAVDLYERQRAEHPKRFPLPFHAFYLVLAENLYERGWSAEERATRATALREEYERAGDELARAAVYEGVARIPRLSDHEEARRMVDRVLSELSGGARETLRDQLDYRKAQELRAKLR